MFLALTAIKEIAASRGYDRSAAGLSRALDDLISMHAAGLPLDLGDELLMAMNESDADLMLAADDGYVLPAGAYGPKPALPCDTVEQVLASWDKLHRHYRKRLSAGDFDDARTCLIDAADELGIQLHDPFRTSLDPDGTPAVAASFAQMPLSRAASEVDRYLAMTGAPVPDRSLTSPADLRLAGLPVMSGSASVLPGMSEADEIAQRHARTGLFGGKASRVKGQTVTHDFSDEDDPRHGQPDARRGCAPGSRAPDGRAQQRTRPGVRRGAAAAGQPHQRVTQDQQVRALAGPPRGFGSYSSPYLGI